MRKPALLAMLAVAMGHFGTDALLAQRPPGTDVLSPAARARMNEEARLRAVAKAKGEAAAAEFVIAHGLNVILPKLQRTLAVGRNFANPSVEGRSADWAARTCNSSRWMQGTDFEWTSILHPEEALEERVIGISGMVINEHVSGEEVWYTHPFGSDWNTNLAVDAGYEFVFAPGTPDSDPETIGAVRAAPTAVGFPVMNALHVEFDSGLIGNYYRAQAGQEVVVFGRWIVDCGHTSFTSEIHPPLIFVKSDGGDYDPSGITHATVISRPFLVRQTFSGKPLRGYLVDQLAKVFSIPLDPVITGPIFAAAYQMQARPEIATIPFAGIKLVSFEMRPQFKRLSAADRLLVRYRLQVRPGVAAQVVNNGDDSITIWIVMNDVAYEPATLPAAKTNVHHTASDIKAALPDIAGVIDGIRAGGAFSLNPLGDAVLEKGFDTDLYQLPVMVEAPLGDFIPIDSITQGMNLATSSQMPYPIFGTIELKWERH
jgi:hypothetical protein